MRGHPNAPECEDCGERVAPTARGVWRQVTGWVEQRDGGGAHGVSLPSSPLGYLCARCMSNRKNGHRGPDLFGGEW